MIHLVIWEGLTTGEAATVLDCSENAVRVRLHRARRRLARRFQPTEPTQDSGDPHLLLDMEAPQ